MIVRWLKIAAVAALVFFTLSRLTEAETAGADPWTQVQIDAANEAAEVANRRARVATEAAIEAKARADSAEREANNLRQQVDQLRIDLDNLREEMNYRSLH